MTSGWSVLIGTAGGVLSEYTSINDDLDFMDPLYDFGAASFTLTSLDGNVAPVEDMVCRIFWDRGLATEQMHWEGYLTTVQKKQEGNIYFIRAFTLEAMLYVKQTGSARNYLSKSPHVIMQAAGTPDPLNVGQSGLTVITYGSSASVPNKIDGVNPGTVLNRFCTDALNLFMNMKRLCYQGRYGDGSFGLEWTSKLEGVNSSSPRFYLVKRRERAAVYTPEVFNIPDDFSNVRRGSDQAPGCDSTKVIGEGVESSINFTGTTRELVVVDKTIFEFTNADNMAKRLLDIHEKNIEVITTSCYRHNSPTRAGDVITVTQPSASPTDLRVVMRHYSMATRAFIFVIGRPLPDKRESQLGLWSTGTSSSGSTPGGGSGSLMNVRTITMTDTATPLDDIILVDASGGPVTVNLPAAATLKGKPYQIKKIDSSLNPVTIDPNGAETIDGLVTVGIAFQNSAIVPTSDGTNWRLF